MFLEKFTPLAKILTAAGSDGIDKFHLWMNRCFLSKWAFMRIAQMGKGAR